MITYSVDVKRYSNSLNREVKHSGGKIGTIFIKATRLESIKTTSLTEAVRVHSPTTFLETETNIQGGYYRRLVTLTELRT